MTILDNFYDRIRMGQNSKNAVSRPYMAVCTFPVQFDNIDKIRLPVLISNTKADMACF